jgi:hypothetical protein
MSNRAGAQKAIEHDGRNKTICKQLCVVKHVSSRQRMSAASQQKVIEHAGPQQDSCCGRSCCGLCNKTLLLRPLQQDSCCGLCNKTLVAASATRLLLRPLQQDSCCGLYTLSTLLGVYIVRVICYIEERVPISCIAM